LFFLNTQTITKKKIKETEHNFLKLRKLKLKKKKKKKKELGQEKKVELKNATEQEVEKKLEELVMMGKR